jgi:MFS family permease
MWTIVGYALVTAVVLVTIGRFSDIFGRVKLYKFGFLIFTLGSIACALSQNILHANSCETGDYQSVRAVYLSLQDNTNFINGG